MDKISSSLAAQKNWKTMACSRHAAVITEDGHVVCWGSNTRGQCDVPADLENVVSVACGFEYTVALTAYGRVVCCGQNTSGQCDVPADLENVVSIECGCSHTAALTADGCVVCWGVFLDIPADLGRIGTISCNFHQTAVITAEDKQVWCEKQYQKRQNLLYQFAMDPGL